MSGAWFVESSTDCVIGAFAPPACSNVIFTGPTPYTHHTVRTPLPYGSPMAPACVMSVRTFAATTGSGNAGTVICSRPWYCDTLVTSPSAPPRLAQVSFASNGAARTGARPPQMSSYRVPARLFPHLATCGQRMGKTDGGGVLCQSVLTIPEDVSWNAISP